MDRRMQNIAVTLRVSQLMIPRHARRPLPSLFRES